MPVQEGATAKTKRNGPKREERLSNKKGRPASKEGTIAQPSESGTQG